MNDWQHARYGEVWAITTTPDGRYAVLAYVNEENPESPIFVDVHNDLHIINNDNILTAHPIFTERPNG